VSCWQLLKRDADHVSPAWDLACDALSTTRCLCPTLAVTQADLKKLRTVFRKIDFE
jgi:hypothetical protein